MSSHFLSADSVDFQLAVQCATAHPKFLRSLAPVPVCFLERVQDELLFSLLYRDIRAGERRADGCSPSIGRNSATDVRRQVAPSDDFASREDYRVLNRGLEFANVARPRILQQSFHGVSRNACHVPRVL